MIQLSDYAARVLDRIDMIGMWIAVVVSVRNFMVCYAQYRRTRGRIHLANIAQVVVFAIHKLLYGIIPLFEITTCVFFPFLISLWHIDYLLFYLVMFMRLIILEPDFHSRWIKIVGILLIAVRFAAWPFELAYSNLQEKLMRQPVMQGGTCWAEWGNGVIILNFIGDVLANLFLSGMFVRRLYLHLRNSKTIMSRQNRIIEHIARKSLVCLILTFIVNLAMNLLKVTTFLGTRSDVFTVYFALVESTLLVEALRVDYTRLPDQMFCEHCGNVVRNPHSTSDSRKKKGSNSDPEYLNISLRIPESLQADPKNHNVHRSSSQRQLTQHDEEEYHPMTTVVTVDPSLLPPPPRESINEREVVSAPGSIDFLRSPPYKRTVEERGTSSMNRIS